MKSTRMAMALFTSLSLLAVACGDDDEDSADATTAVTEAAGAADTTPAAADTTPAAEDTTPAAETTAAAGEIDYMWTPNADVLAGAEGQVNIVAWPSYIEDGSTSPDADWVTPFVDMTGCAVNVKLGSTSDEMVQLMQSGEYDGVSASGDATQRLMSGGEVAALDLAEFTSYADIFEGLKDKPWNSLDGEAMGIPHGRGANLLVFNTEAFPDGLDSWGVMFDGGTVADAAVSVYDSPIYIADAALYLMATQPDLGITNPYALDQTQFDASMALLAVAGSARRSVLDRLPGAGGIVGRRHRAGRHDVASCRNVRAGRRSQDRHGQAQGGCYRVERHLDAVVEGEEPQLHEAVDGLDLVALGQRSSHRILRRGTQQRQGLRADCQR